MTKRTLCLACILLLAFCATALAQDVFQVNYFRNANTRGAPDATVSIDNPGPSGGSLCSMIYVFLPDQQMSECCGCLNSPDDLFTLSVNNLTSNPLTGTVTTAGVIKIVSSAPSSGVCNPSILSPTPDLRAWATHIQNKIGSAYPITETAFLDAPLGATEQASLENDCAAIFLLGSGHGICSCGILE